MRRTFRSALRAMRLHRDVSVQMVERAICLLASIPATLVHALDLFISPARALVLLRAGDGHERVNLRERVLPSWSAIVRRTKEREREMRRKRVRPIHSRHVRRRARTIERATHQKKEKQNNKTRLLSKRVDLPRALASGVRPDQCRARQRRRGRRSRTQVFIFTRQEGWAYYLSRTYRCSRGGC